jgi:hypothetical protein
VINDWYAHANDRYKSRLNRYARRLAHQIDADPRH